MVANNVNTTQKSQIEKNNKELFELYQLTTPKKSLSIGILKRFMSEVEYKKLMESYISNKQTSGIGDRNRAIRWSRPITNEEMAVLTTYLTETDTTITQLEKDLKLRDKTMTPKCFGIAIRFLFQNKDLMGI